MTYVLWADDDADSYLAPLREEMEENGLSVTVALDYGRAHELALGSVSGSVLVVDAILPDLRPTAPLGLFLGIKLADICVRSGRFGRVAVLTVVPEIRLQSEIDALRKACAATDTIRYVDKTRLLEPSTIDALIHFLQGIPDKQGSE